MAVTVIGGPDGVGSGGNSRRDRGSRIGIADQPVKEREFSRKAIFCKALLISMPYDEIRLAHALPDQVDHDCVKRMPYRTGFPHGGFRGRGSVIGVAAADGDDDDRDP
ncbi:MAG: hypothetical protein LCH80_10125 [Proteobacteria bacterium]|nr:hypothetical protein [Pseudomonadota bacterium]